MVDILKQVVFKLINYRNQVHLCKHEQCWQQCDLKCMRIITIKLIIHQITFAKTPIVGNLTTEKKIMNTFIEHILLFTIIKETVILQKNETNVYFLQKRNLIQHKNSLFFKSSVYYPYFNAGLVKPHA